LPVLLKVTDAELAKAESLTRESHYPRVYCWRDGDWMELPSARTPDYALPIGSSGPRFNPTGMQIVAASRGKAEAAIAGISVEKSQRSPEDKPWYWLRGDTYPHRDTLKRWGCRWSRKRKAWYLIADELPSAIQELIKQANTPPAAEEDADPCSVEEAAAVLGMRVKDDPAPKDQSATPPAMFAINATVYARHELTTPDGQTIPSGTKGRIIRLYTRNPRHGWSYDVDFEGIGTGWYFERELTDLEPLPDIRVTRGQVVPPGAVPPASDAEIKQALVEGGHTPEAVEPEATPTATRKAAETSAYDLIPNWMELPDLGETEDIPADEKVVQVKLFTPWSSWTWFIVEYDTLKDLAFGFAFDATNPYGAEWGDISIQELRELRGPFGLKVERDLWFDPKPFKEAKKSLGLEDAEPAAPIEPEDEEEEEQVPPVTITPAPVLPADPEDMTPVQQAIHHSKRLTLKPLPVVSQRAKDVLPIPQAYCGELTGSITGDVHCYGYAHDEGRLIYLNLGGPRVRRMTA
jgi:hypothetical protein